MPSFYPAVFTAAKKECVGTRSEVPINFVETKGFEGVYLLRLALKEELIAYCLLDGRLLYVTEACRECLGWDKFHKKCHNCATMDAIDLIGMNVHSFLANSDSSRLFHGTKELQGDETLFGQPRASIGRLPMLGESNIPRKVKLRFSSSSLSPTLHVELVYAPRNYRLQRCMDAMMGLGIHGPRSNRSSFVIDATKEREVILCSSETMMIPPESNSQPQISGFQVRKCFQEKSLADFAFEIDECSN